MGDYSEDSRVENNIIIDCYVGIEVISPQQDFIAQNNTIYACVHGIRNSSGTNSDHMFAYNNAVFNCSTADFTGAFNSSSDHNVSSDTSAPGTTTATGQTDYEDYFIDYENGDFHLLDTSDNLWGVAGTDLSSSFTDDIDGETRSEWDVGADEYNEDDIYFSEDFDYTTGSLPPTWTAKWDTDTTYTVESETEASYGG